MSIRASACGILVGALLSACAVPEWYRSGDEFERPPADPSATAPSDGTPPAGTEVATAPPAPPPPVMGPAGAGDGWDSAPPAGTTTARDPLSDPNAYPPPPPAPATAPPPANPPPLAPGAMAAGTSDSDPLYYSFLGKEPPELASNGAWLTPASAASLAGLRGQVVFVFFAFQGCPSCGLMTPYLQQWQQMFGAQGFTVVYVNNGLMAGEEAARKAIAAESLAFPYFHDAKGETLRQFGIRSFPTAYLLDRQGKVQWEGAPVALESQVQSRIVELLK